MRQGRREVPESMAIVGSLLIPSCSADKVAPGSLRPAAVAQHCCQHRVP